ncbi:MAG TPA: hypothetical protein VG944_00575 [Fimbriimonas sp.]|nr:hypothetical protein [Fimbriimonas sp.]
MSDKVLTQGLRQAREWMITGEELLQPSIDSYDEDDLATDLVLRLRSVAVPEFYAILTLLVHQVEAIAADVLIRSLLEALAHAAWIVDGEAESDASSGRACRGDDRSRVSVIRRAHCLEYGMAKQFALSVQKGSPASMAVRTPADAEAWLSEAEEAHRQTGCGGVGRGYRDVARTLTHFGERMNLGAWPVDLWRVTSGVGHQLMPQQFAQDVEGTTLWGAPLSVIERLKRLDRAAKVMANFYQYVVLVVSPDDLAAYHRQTQTLVTSLAQTLSRIDQSTS